MLMRVPVSACRDLSALGEQLDRVLWGVPMRGQVGGLSVVGSAGFVRGRVSGVAFRVYRDEDSILVEADLPGIRAEDVEIDATATGVSIRAERRLTRPEGATLLRGERSSWTVLRSFDLPVEIDVDRTSADLRDGVLRVTLPIAEKARPRRVSVGAGEGRSREVVESPASEKGECCMNGASSGGSSCNGQG